MKKIYENYQHADGKLFGERFIAYFVRSDGTHTIEWYLTPGESVGYNRFYNFKTVEEARECWKQLRAEMARINFVRVK